MAIKRGAWTPDRSPRGGMNTKLHAICDSRGRPLNPFVTASLATTSMHVHCGAACRMSTGCSGTADTTPTGSEMRCKTKGYAPAFPAESNVRHQPNTTNTDTDGATVSRSCSDWCRVPTRYDRCPQAFLSVLAATVIYWICVLTLSLRAGRQASSVMPEAPSRLKTDSRRARFPKSAKSSGPVPVSNVWAGKAEIWS